jgi:hypothetical protein
MAVDRRQWLMAGAAVIALVLAVTLMWPASRASSTPPARAARPPARAKSAHGAETTSSGPVAPVKLKALSETRDEPGEAKRNPFRFQPKAAPPPPKPVIVAAPSQPTEAARPAPPPGPPPLPPIPLKLIGVLERANGVKWAVLTDGKSPTPMYGKDGDIIDGRYQIVKIGTESIEMTYADGRGRTVIRLSGQ